MPGCKISNDLKNNNFVTSFMHLKLRREHRSTVDYMEVRESKAGLGLQDS